MNPHSFLHYFIVITNELTNGTDVPRLSQTLLKSFSKETTSSLTNLGVATTSLVVHLLQIRAAYKKALFFAESSARVLEWQIERVTKELSLILRYQISQSSYFSTYIALTIKKNIKLRNISKTKLISSTCVLQKNARNKMDISIYRYNSVNL